jgi:hypothetical protein
MHYNYDLFFNRQMGWARKCAVLGCENENSHRHRFPQPDKYVDLYKRWVEACGNPILHQRNPHEVYRSYRVCHAHFTSKDISSNMYLKKGVSVPTCNLPMQDINQTLSTL